MNPSSALLSPTPMQEGIWVVEQAGGMGTAHHVVDARCISGTLEAEALQRCVSALTQRHDALQLRVPTTDGMPLLALDPAAQVPVVWLGRQRESDLVFTLQEAARQPFALATGPLMRAVVAEVEDAWVLMLCAHQIAIDAASLDIVWRDLLAMYEAILRGVDAALPPAPSFREWVQACNTRSDTAPMLQSLAYWKSRLSKPVPILVLPDGDPASNAMPIADASSDAVAPYAPAMTAATCSRVAALPAALHREMAAQEARGCSPLVVAAAGLAVLLYRYAGESDVTIGHPCRVPVDDAELALVGSLVNMVVLRMEVAGTSGFVEVLDATGRVVEEALTQREAPFPRVVTSVGPKRRTRQDPFLQVVLSWHEADHPLATRVDTLITEPMAIDVATPANADFSIHLTWSSRAASLRLDFIDGVLSGAMADQLLRHLLTVISSGLAAPAEPIDHLAFLSDAEVQLLVADRAGTTAVVHPTTVVDAIALQVTDVGGRVAVSQGDERWTYDDLWIAAGRVAFALQSRGIGAGSVVGVSMERRPLLIATLLGIWRAGAAFVPLDPQFPIERLRYMANDATCGLVIADAAVEWAPESVPLATADALCNHPLDATTTATALRHPAASALAYRIYTSGSTGRPKGVDVSHGALQNLLQSMAVEPGCVASDVLLAVTTLSFDIAGLELWLPLTVGAQVEVAAGEELLDPGALMRHLHACGATIMQATPSTWRMLLAANWSGHLRRILCGGEAFPPDLVGPLSARGDAVYNLYGPTETTIWSTLVRVDAVQHRRQIPIGRPIHNTRVYVVDARGQLAPPGVVGEVWIAGDGVATGYHAQPALSADRFVADPFVAGGKAYRTGDLGRWTSGGDLLHLGRIDQQLKVSGYRIEAGEIESALVAIPSIQQAVATVSGPVSDGRLVAYLVFEPSATARPSASHLRRVLRRHLPDYMIPAMIVDLPELPLTPNGKVDRRALPDPFHDTARTAPGFEAPKTDVEIAIAAVWRELLGGDAVGRHDNFFERGGHSLLAVRAVWLLKQRHGIVRDPRALFFGTLAQLAEGTR